MAGDIIDALSRLLSPEGNTHIGAVQDVLIHDGTVDEAGNGHIKHTAPECIPDGIAEESKFRNQVGIVLGAEGNIGLRHTSFHGPALTVENHIGVLLVDLLHDGIDGIGIDEAHQVKTEAIDVVLVSPVGNGIHQILADHAALGGGIIAAGRAVGVGTTAVGAAEILGNQLIEAEVLGLINMIVDNVHNHADAVFVEALDHLLDFLHTDFTVIGVGGIGALGNIEVHRVVTPVELRLVQPMLVHRAVVIHGQDMQMGNTQLLIMVNTGGNAGRGLGAIFDHAQVLAPIDGIGAFVNGKITDMGFRDDHIGQGDTAVGILIIFPALGIGGLEIQDHGPLTVDTGGSGIRVAGFHPLAADGNTEGVIGAMEVFGNFCDPGAVNILFHADLTDQIIRIGVTGNIQIEPGRGGSGCPEPEEGLIGSPGGAQIRAGIGILGFKILSGIGDRHTDCNSISTV